MEAQKRGTQTPLTYHGTTLDQELTVDSVSVSCPAGFRFDRNLCSKLFCALCRHSWILSIVW